MHIRKLALAAALAVVAPLASAATLDPSSYHLAGTYNIGMLANDEEASAVTYNRATGTLFVLGDEGFNITQISTTGAYINSMALSGFRDTEGLTYVGSGQFVITEERRRQAFLFSYAAGGSQAKTSMLGAQLDPSLGDSPEATTNVGIEGLSYDARTGTFVYVKEKGVP